MKTLITCALVLCLSASAAAADDVSISFSSKDPRTRVAPRYVARNARLAITTRGGAAMLLLTNDVVAVQLSDATLDEVETKHDANFLEEMIVAGVRHGLSKAVEYPVANIRSAEIRNGVLVLTNDQGKPVFEEVKVNGRNVTHALSVADAARFVRELRRVQSAR